MGFEIMIIERMCSELSAQRSSDNLGRLLNTFVLVEHGNSIVLAVVEGNFCQSTFSIPRVV